MGKWFVYHEHQPRFHRKVVHAPSWILKYPSLKCMMISTTHVFKVYDDLKYLSFLCIDFMLKIL